MLGDRRKAMFIHRALLVSLTKREYVDFSRISDSLFYVVFPTLLWGGDHSNPVFGRWAGDQVVLVIDWDMSFTKCNRLARSGKLELPGHVVNELWKREEETLSRVVWRKFTDITDDVVKALRYVYPEDIRRWVKSVW
jgi:hypothetical protein